MDNYANKLNQTNTQQTNILKRNTLSGNKWTSVQIQHSNINHAMGKRIKIHTKLANLNNTRIKLNYDLFADDASIHINNIIHMKPLLDTYNDSVNEYPLIIQWGKLR